MSNRARQARETRRRIVEAAARLFVRDGYSATSISSIAEEAEVAVPTVYASLRSKANILRAVVELTVRGDDEVTPLSSRPDWHEIERQPDPREKLALFTRLHRQICDREAAVFAQLGPAGPPTSSGRSPANAPISRSCATEDGRPTTTKGGSPSSSWPPFCRSSRRRRPAKAVEPVPLPVPPSALSSAT
jgi:AcrR family transcriptional regulator